MTRLLALIPILFLAACATTFAQDSTPRPTPEPLPETPETGCLYFKNLVNNLTWAAKGQGEWPEHPSRAYIAHYRDVYFADEPELYGAAEVLFQQVATNDPLSSRYNWYERDSWAAVTAARHIARFCLAAGYEYPMLSTDIIVELSCANGAKFARVHKYKDGGNPMLARYARPHCNGDRPETHTHGYIPYDHEHD